MHVPSKAETLQSNQPTTLNSSSILYSLQARASPHTFGWCQYKALGPRPFEAGRHSQAPPAAAFLPWKQRPAWCLSARTQHARPRRYGHLGPADHSNGGLG
eukprot:1158347-Pelagomonas_calceolata.AAC.1